MRHAFEILIALFFLVSAALARPAPAQDPWQSTVVTHGRKDEPTYYNSQRLAVDRRGRPHAIYVETTGTTDTLYHATSVAEQWQREPVYTMMHSGNIVSGLSGYTLALDRRDQPRIYLYTSDYADAGPIFEEQCAHRDAKGWQLLRIRRSVNSMGGAAMHDPHLAVDELGNMHVSAYVHAGHGVTHRACHRYFDGSAFQIDALPRPHGKSDSQVSNLFIDHRNVIHFVYDSKKALGRGNAEAGYPDSSLVYVTRQGASWSTPELVRDRVGPDPSDTNYFVMSSGLFVDRRGGVHVTYAISKRKSENAADVYYVHGQRGEWREELVASVAPPESGPIQIAVSSPALDRQQDPHFAFDSPDGTMYVRRKGGQWQTETLEGTLEGFALDPKAGVHVLTSFGHRLTHHFQSTQ